jgi:hypothetical protein
VCSAAVQPSLPTSYTLPIVRLRHAGACARGPPSGSPITGAMLVIPHVLPGSRPAQSLLNFVKASPSPQDLARGLTRGAVGRWPRRACAGRHAYGHPLIRDVDGVETVSQIGGRCPV